jgi:hypothetical protein
MQSTTTNHREATVERIAYIVRRTYFDSTPHTDEARFDVEPEFLAGQASYTHAYTLALECAHSVRCEPDHNGYAVIDSVDTDGVRHAG